MEDIISRLHNNHEPQRVCEACLEAVRILKEEQFNELVPSETIKEDVVGNCFMTVFLTFSKNKTVISVITDAIVQLVTQYPNLKHQYGSKGLFFNIMDLFTIFNETPNPSPERKIFLVCGLKLAVALITNCSQNLPFCMDAGVISIFPAIFKTCSTHKEVVYFGIHLLCLLICDTKDDSEEINILRQLWLNQCYVDKINDERLLSLILGVMNRFLGQSSSLQVYTIKCLQAFSYLDPLCLLEYGIVDSLVHACLHYSKNPEVHSNALKCLLPLLNKPLLDHVWNKYEEIVDLIFSSINNFNDDVHVISHVFLVVKKLILLDPRISEALILKNIPSLFYQQLAKYHKKNMDVHPILKQALYMFAMDSNIKYRNETLINACKHGAIGEMLFFLYLGANINYTSKCEQTALMVACENRNLGMVKAIISAVCSFHDIGAPNSRLLNVTDCLKFCLDQDYCEIATILLWYLVYQNQNETAEWSKIGLNCFHSYWLGDIFDFVEKESSVLNSYCGKKNLQLVETIFVDEMPIFDEENTELHERFQISSTELPWQLLQDNPTTKDTNLTRLNSDEYDEFVCPRCCVTSSFKDALHLSFIERDDADILSREKVPQTPSKENCACHIPFPPRSVCIKDIELSHNHLTSLQFFACMPKEIGCKLGQNIVKLNICSNELKEFPPSLLKIFCNIKELLLANNYIQDFPFGHLHFCQNLQLLNLSGNLLRNKLKENKTKASAYKSGTSNVTVLKLSNNSFTSLPSWIIFMPHLSVLDLGGNMLCDFMPENKEKFHTALRNLRVLKLNKNSILAFDFSVLECFPLLEHLDLSSNEIQECIFDEHQGSSSLQYLDLARNSLGAVPLFLHLLPKLQTLNLCGNVISTFPKTVQWKPTRLLWLDISENEISDIAHLISLITYSFSKLRVLNLSYNKICTIPTELGQLKSLEILDISHNKIKTLPNELGNLFSLTKLSIEGNILSINTSVLEGNTQQIRTFLYERLKKAVPHNRVKLMLLGHPSAGKTTLLQALLKHKSFRYRTFSNGLVPKVLEKHEVKTSPPLATIGVDVSDLTLKHHDRTFNISVWDFAGQEDFYATHPCFLSERAMYIIVYDGSKGPHQLQTLKPWLTAIHARAAHCPVLLFASHADCVSSEIRDSLSDILKKELKSLSKSLWFPKNLSKNLLQNHDFVDVREGSRNITMIRNKICNILADSIIQGNPLIGAMVPYSYVQLEKVLETEAKSREAFPVLDFSELAGKLREVSAGKEPLFESSSELMIAMNYLHQTGVLLHFEDHRSNLNDCFFIKPAWLCQFIAQVISLPDHKNFKVNPYISKDGIVSKQIIHDNLIHSKDSDMTFNPEFLPSLLRLLENFEVIISQDDDKYLVPSKLPSEKPILEDLGNLCERIYRYMSMAYIPMGFWPRLIARLLSFSGSLVTGNRINIEKNLPDLVNTWNEGIFMKWTNKMNSYMLIQNGCDMFKSATNCSLISERLNEDTPSRNKFSNDGLEVIVPNTQNGVIILCQVVDHINNLIGEWYPGLLRLDWSGCPLFLQFAPCEKCLGLLSTNSSSPVHVFCINDIVDSVMCMSSKVKYKELTRSTCKVETSSGLINVFCPNHTDPVTTQQFAPEVNFDDCDAKFKLDVDRLTYEPNPHNLLGDGGFGCVYRAKYDGRDIAIKTFHMTTPDSLFRMLRAELNVLVHHQHPSIISLFGFLPPSCLNEDMLLPFLAMEFAQMGSLGDYLRQMTAIDAPSRRNALPTSVKHRIMFEVADCLAFLNSRHIVYRDLKPDNILLFSLDITAPILCKITDYGISILASPSGCPSPGGSPGYSAPEVISIKTGGKHKSIDLFPYSVNCDVYSYGLLMHEVAVGKSPWLEYVAEEFNSETDISLSSCHPDDVILKGIRPSSLSAYEGVLAWPHAQNLIGTCLSWNPEDRPSSKSILKTLSDIESCCMRLQEYVHPSSLIWCTCVKRNRDCLPQKESFQGNLDIYWLCMNRNELEENSQNITKLPIGTETFQILKQEIVCEWGDHLKISCMIVATSEQDYVPTFVGGTSKGEIAVCSFQLSKVVAHVGAPVTSLALHQPTENRPNNFVVAGLANGAIVVYDMEQLSSGNGNSLSEVSLAEVACENPISQLASLGKTLFATCGQFLVTLSLVDSGGPSICSVKPLPSEDKITNRSTSITLLALSSTTVYVVTKKSSVIWFWQTGNAQRNRIDIRDFTEQSQRPYVTSLFVDHRHATFWVGTSDGHVFLFREPLHNHVLRSSSRPVVVMHRHVAMVEHIFAAPRRGDDTESPGYVFCVGVGNVPLVKHDKEDTGVGSRRGSRKRMPSIENQSELVAFEADIADKKEWFTSAVEARSLMTTSE